MKKVTVIGGSGFVGITFCKTLRAEGVPFEIIDLKKSRTFPAETKIADIRDKSSLDGLITGDVIVLLAAIHVDNVQNRQAYYDTNVTGTKHVCDVATELGIKKIVFTSSVAVYGFAPLDTGEDGKRNPFNDYGKSKAEGEDVLKQWRKETGGQLIMVRPTVIFGEGNRGNVYNLFSKIASKQFVMIGPGKNKKSMAYNENVAAFLLETLKSDDDFNVINYTDGPDLNMNALVARAKSTLFGSPKIGLRLPYTAGRVVGFFLDGVTKVTGKTFPISSIRVKKFCSDTSFSSASKSFGNFVPPYTLEEGIDRTLNSEFINFDPDREIFYTE